MNNTNKIQLTHSLMLLGKRIVPTFFNEYSPQRFKKWQYNACRQTAIVVAQYLSELDNFKDRDIQVWEGNFFDEALGQYDHAWVYINDTDNESGLFVDVSRVTYPCVVRWMDGMPSNIGEMFSLLADRRLGTVHELNRIMVDWKPILEENEYYTGLPYRGVAVRMIKILKETTTKQ